MPHSLRSSPGGAPRSSTTGYRWPQHLAFSINHRPPSVGNRSVSRTCYPRWGATFDLIHLFQKNMSLCGGSSARERPLTSWTTSCDYVYVYLYLSRVYVKKFHVKGFIIPTIPLFDTLLRCQQNDIIKPQKLISWQCRAVPLIIVNYRHFWQYAICNKNLKVKIWYDLPNFLSCIISNWLIWIMY